MRRDTRSKRERKKAEGRELRRKMVDEYRKRSLERVRSQEWEKRR